MKKFYCNGKKDICNDDTKCCECKYYDGSGGREINASPKHFKDRLLRLLKAIKGGGDE